MFKHNIAAPAQLKTLTDFLHASNGCKEPLFIAVDQEGGHVLRLNASNGFTDYLSHEAVAQTLSVDEAYAYYIGLASELKKYGINLNLAPVVDVNIDPDSPAIGRKRRSFSSDAYVVYEYASAFIRAHRDAGVLTTIKHWPGHGSANADSHRGMVDVTKTWHTSETIPYERLIADGLVDGVMTAHVFHRGLDKDNPATLSPTLIDGKLRGELGFDGVVFTDCLQMGAISELFNDRIEDAGIEAIMAGADILVVSNYWHDDNDLVERLEEKIRLGALANRIEESNARIAAFKKRLARSHDEL